MIRGAPEAVDSLCIVTNYRQLAPAFLQVIYDRDLWGVAVLEQWHQRSQVQSFCFG